MLHWWNYMMAENLVIPLSNVYFAFQFYWYVWRWILYAVMLSPGFLKWKTKTVSSYSILFHLISSLSTSANFGPEVQFTRHQL